MRKFNDGDLVICVGPDDTDRLTRHKVYRVLGYRMSDVITIVDDSGFKAGWLEDRFKLAPKLVEEKNKTVYFDVL